ncbi:MAG TPA: hypothetical protein VNM47_07380 [Terriglobia bacterium]|nr:hypothetical protein [Terriglobia bacterium]
MILKLGLDDHMHCAIDAHNYPDTANPQDQIIRKLGPEYSALLQVVEQHIPRFHILEGHICSVPGRKRKYVHLIARGHEAIVSIILTKRQNEGFPSGRLFAASASGPVKLFEAHLKGMDVAGFETKGYFGYVVSDLGRGEVLHMANALAAPVRDTLDGTATPGTTKASNSIPSLSGYLAWICLRPNDQPLSR